MTMQFPKSLHADDGLMDHMPAGHQVDIDMNPGELPSSRDRVSTRRHNPLGPKGRSTLGRSTRPANIVMGGGEPEVDSSCTVVTPPPPRRSIKSSHASAWILGAAVCATGGALAVATMHEGHRNTTVAEVSNPASDTAPATTASTTLAAAPEATAASSEASAPAVQEPGPAPAPVKLAQATAAQDSSSDAPLPRIAPAAGRSAVKERVPAEPVAKKLATLTESSRAATDQLVAQSTMPDQPLTAQSVQPMQPVQPVQPLTAPPVQPPVTVAPPLTTEPPPLEVAPPPVQPPASGPQ